MTTAQIETLFESLAPETAASMAVAERGMLLSVAKAMAPALEAQCDPAVRARALAFLKEQITESEKHITFPDAVR